MLLSLGTHISMNEGYVRPEFGSGEACSLIIKGGRHPVIESVQQANHATFVPGDVYFGASSNFGPCLLPNLSVSKLWKNVSMHDRVWITVSIAIWTNTRGNGIDIHL